jgi:glycogen phosphorylase
MTAARDGATDIALAVETLAASLPPPLRPLARVAYDLRWSWLPGGEEVFRAVSPERWTRCDHNPVRLLGEAGARALERAAADADLVRRAAALEERLARDRAGPCAPGSLDPARPAAFFCAEYALHRSLPVYAGGLGALAGDLLKEAADRAVPMVGVGLLYRQGYFRQRLDASGWQHEHWVEADVERLPAVLVTGADDRPLVVSVPFLAEQIAAQIWRLDVGRVPLYLLDSDRPENARVDRWVTSRLYVGDRQMRLAQYLLLGVGGVRALRAMGIEPGVVHLNEGHAVFAALELAREQVAAGRPFAEALAAARARCVFTTHTPVAAGNESYDAGEILEPLRGYLPALGIGANELLALGQTPASADGRFGLTPLALRASRRANGVSRRHGEVAREMWRGMWPERTVADVPIKHVTNGVHLATWMAPEMAALLDRHVSGWRERTNDPAAWDGVAAIPDEELWAVRNQLRARLVEYVRDRSVLDRLSRGDPREYVEAAAHTFDPQVITFGFARRLATYKRVYLLTHDPARSLRLLAAERPLQLVIAGKAHPLDDAAKRVVQGQLFPLRHDPHVGPRVAFLEDHDLAMAAQLVRGCDVWINLPRPPHEASGTSGMKAALNGGLNLSILDGWWEEAWDGENGWGFPGAATGEPTRDDASDAERFYDLMERDIVPRFYDRGPDGIPHRWLAHVKRSLATIAPRFGAGRMLADYLRSAYQES